MHFRYPVLYQFFTKYFQMLLNGEFYGFKVQLANLLTWSRWREGESTLQRRTERALIDI